MQIKKYLASNMTEALDQVKRELGPEALIISTKNLKKGNYTDQGTLQNDMVEIMAAIDTEQQQNQTFKSPQPSKSNYDQFDLPLEFIRNEIGSLKSIIEKGFAQQKNQPEISSIYQQIRYLGVEEDIAGELIKTISQNNTSIFKSGHLSIEKYLQNLFSHLIKTSGPIDLSEKLPQIVAMVGPTGTGKTTTIAKLAGAFTLNEKRNVGLISLDTQKVAGVEQLKCYAKIMGLPVMIANTKNQIKNHLKDLKKMDCIFIDTGGYNPKDTKRMERLSDLLDIIPDLEKHLVVSATTQGKDLLNITKNFQKLNINKLLFTKLDETTQLGTIFNHMIYTNLSLSYLGTGQHIPDDLLVATPNLVSELIINGKLPSMETIKDES